MTPELLALRESVQHNDGLVPGGFLVFVVYERVPGIRLAGDTRLYPGFPLHTFFTKFDRAERDTIRDKFDEVYPVFAKMDYFPVGYFIDFRGANPIYRAVRANPDYRDGKLITDAANHWEDWGLAIRPDDPNDGGRPSAWTL
ncbi:hypothetical protein N7541_005377 [Penicillium brevicompactum]|uniref:Uncharacterized protein n=1 Tax=Penicillium brevicompactum TaxID=5074 RepID=A0A9W9RFZ7_PENBR|nr:hypothetical protein N7541_005377 [Penicillium brevicompactum]